MSKIIINIKKGKSRLLIITDNWEDGVLLLDEAMERLDSVPINNKEELC